MATPAQPDTKTLTGATDDASAGGLFQTGGQSHLTTIQQAIVEDVNAAEAAKVAAQAAQAAAETAETNAETAEANAETAKTAAETAKTLAETAKTGAETAETNAETAEANAATSETNAATSATNAANSEVAAETAETNAQTSETNAATSETSAATSATNAATSATSASTSATTATTKATEASNSATQAATSATNASTSETNASNSATAASNSATTASTKASEASTSAATATTKASEASTSETNASTSATTATTKASEASTSATNAATSESNASTSATAAAASQLAAANSAASAANTYDLFDDRYLGTKTADPTVDNDGNALVEGTLYFNSTENEMRVYDGGSWIAASSAGSASMLEYRYTATAGQTTFSGSDDSSNTLSYTADNLIVTVNGIVLENGTDYTATSGTSIVLTTASVVNDEVNIIAFKSFTLADAVSATNGGTFQGSVEFTSGLVANGLTYPTTDGTANQVIKTDGSGTLAFFSPDYYDDSDVDAHLTGGTGVTYNAGDISIGQSVGTADDVTFNSVTGDLFGAVEFEAKNTEGSTITAGTPVYLKGHSGNDPEIGIADANDAAKMPAFGIASADISNNNKGDIVTFGDYIGFDTSAFSVGDELFVSNTGTLTATRPTGNDDAVQKMAKVVRSHAQNGQLFVMGAGRSNDIPNSTSRNIQFTDNAKVKFGTGEDLEIFHDGLHSYIKDTGTGDLRVSAENFHIRSNTGDEPMATFTYNGPVALYYDSSVKLSTSSLGVSVTGTVTATSFSGDGSNLTNLPETGDGGIAMAIALG